MILGNHITGSFSGEEEFTTDGRKEIGARNADGSISSFQLFPRKRTSAALVRFYGASSNGTGIYTFCQTLTAPAHFDAVQITLNGQDSTANQFKVSVAVSAKFNNGWQPVDSADAPLAFTPVTFGTTDRLNPRNPGGGSATAVVGGTSGSNATFNLIEGDVPSDVIKLRSLDRTDDATKNPLLFIRLFGTNPPGAAVNESSAAHANPISSVEEFYSGYWATNDYTGSVPPGAPTGGWLPSLTVTFFLRGKVVNVVGVAGDSVEQGWVQAAAVPQFGGNINGWPRRLVKKLNQAGITTSYVAACHTGNRASAFHERAINMLNTGRLTHLFIKPWSVNGYADGVQAMRDDLQRCQLIIQRCLDLRVVPIIIQPWGGQNSGTTIRNEVDAWIDLQRMSGVPVFDPRAITDDATGGLKSTYKTITAGGAVVDSIHPNDAGQEDIANLAFEMAINFQLI